MRKNRDTEGRPSPFNLSTGVGDADSTHGITQVEQTLSVDTALQLLGARRRRMLLYHVVSQPVKTVAIEALIEQLVEWEQALGETYPDHNAQIRRSLKYTHLPRLEANGIIEYSLADDRCRYYRQPFLEDLLDTIVPHESEGISGVPPSTDGDLVSRR